MAFAALPFDENLMNLPHGNGGSAANFFIDTAMLAQQIAAVVADEKKLSDNIMDLMPPPMPIVTSAANLATSGMLTSTTASTTTSMSLTTPLAPPPELMMRALSPPMSLLPELSQPHPVPPLSLDGSSAVQTTSTASVTTKAPVKAEPTQPPASAPAPVPVSAPVVAATPLPPPPSILDDRRKPVINNHAALLKKRKSAEAFGDIKSEHSLPTASSLAALSSLNPGSSTTSNNGVMSTAAAVAAAAREKVMKEPQSGDLYECVITKRNGGLGLTLACVDDHVQITGLAPDTPAANSGICVGDTLVAVSGLPVRGLQFSTVIGRLKSTSRSSVVLKLRRNPFRQNAGGSAPYRGIKRPARPASKTSESNSANVLSSKSMALETRLGGTGMNGVNGSMLNGAGNGVDDAHHHHHGVHASHLNHLHMKVEPMNSSYFPTDASILTMGPSSALLSSQSATSLPGSAELQWKVSTEEKDRYFAECRALKHELACAMLARRSEKRHAEEYAGQLQEVVDKFQSDMKALLKTPPSSLSGSNGSSNEDLVALRQKLLEVNHALARQQTEILELKERETRHALPESQRVKWQIVMLIKKSMYQLDLKTLAVTSSSASSAGSSASSSPVPNLASSISKTSMTEKEPPVKKQTFEERLDGIRPSVFELLFRQDMKVPAMATAPSIGLDLDAKACTQMLGWNLREVVSQGNVGYVVFVENFVHVKYLRAEEALVISWQFNVQEYNY
uniref:PDZ domain-containing protein n=1 Tax=Globisporangium ultimum (strain ATCC 200006 / CBS 805.95 / DAOM BR144) TaxID=431595 RepID=K3W948_GLOUD